MNLVQLGKRFLQMLAVLLCVSFCTFLLTYLAPGDPAVAMYESSGIIPTDDMLLKARSAMGLDKPFYQQYAIWLGNCMRGNLGMSFSKKAPVYDLLRQRLLPTVQLALSALVMMLIVSIPAGILSATKQNKGIDHVIRGATFAGISMPGFWVGLILLYGHLY